MHALIIAPVICSVKNLYKTFADFKTCKLKTELSAVRLQPSMSSKNVKKLTTTNIYKNR